MGQGVVVLVFQRVAVSLSVVTHLQGFARKEGHLVGVEAVVTRPGCGQAPFLTVVHQFFEF